MMKACAFKSHIEPLIIEITGTQHIPISQICNSDKRKSKGIIEDKNLSKVCSTYESESESVIVDGNSVEERKSERV